MSEMNSVKLFTAKDIKNLRESVVCLPRKRPRGWSKSKIEPVEVLKTFSALRLKKGLALRAYQFGAGNNGNAVVWAMPEESPFPSPKCCPKLKDTFLECPRPPLALDDIMEVIEGDGSLWSYLSASIFVREMHEFGALWHGCDWSTHEIIDKALPDYFKQAQRNSGERISHTKVNEWTWRKEKPKEWQPSVCKKNDKVIVTFYSFSGLSTEAIYRHVDTFSIGSYSFKTKEVMMGEGCGGYVF